MLQSIVSIPFIAGQWSLQVDGRRCYSLLFRVSIPFIAGQWSLLYGFLERSLDTQCFNPLHCGAVVAFSRDPFYWTLDWFLFQSPSLRGSGRFSTVSRADDVVLILFQSPSLRGSGRFPITSPNPVVVFLGFNPLHCGAVVAST